MVAKVTGGQLLIIISMVFVGVGLFTPLPYYIFSTVGVIGVLVGWLMGIIPSKNDEPDDGSDVNINVVDTHPVNFDERLMKLEQLKKDSIITEEEYKVKRKEIMEDKW